MPAFVLGVIVLILLLFAAYSFSKADPKQVARVLRYIGGGAALLFAAFLPVRGAIGRAVSIGLIGLGCLGYTSLWRASNRSHSADRLEPAFCVGLSAAENLAGAPAARGWPALLLPRYSQD